MPLWGGTNIPDKPIHFSQVFVFVFLPVHEHRFLHPLRKRRHEGFVLICVFLSFWQLSCLFLWFVNFSFGSVFFGRIITLQGDAFSLPSRKVSWLQGPWENWRQLWCSYGVSPLHTHTPLPVLCPCLHGLPLKGAQSVGVRPSGEGRHYSTNPNAPEASALCRGHREVHALFLPPWMSLAVVGDHIPCPPCLISLSSQTLIYILPCCRRGSWRRSISL